MMNSHGRMAKDHLKGDPEANSMWARSDLDYLIRTCQIWTRAAAVVSHAAVISRNSDGDASAYAICLATSCVTCVSNVVGMPRQRIWSSYLDSKQARTAI